MRKRTISLFIIFFICTSFAFGYVFGGSNLGIGGYPKFSGYKPSEPYYSYNTIISSREFDDYRNAVKRYIDAANTYIENANYDIDRIKDAQRDAIDEANNAVTKFNNFADSVKVKSSY